MMMLSVIAMALSLAATLAPNKQTIYTLPTISKNAPLSVYVQGIDKGDVDCYLLVNHRIVAKDENNNNYCDIHYIPTNTDTIKLWIINHGDTTIQYQANIRQ
jgi:hypothetical protein